MIRTQVLAAIKAAGTEGDQRTFLRLYTENRVSYSVARKAYDEGVKWAKYIKEQIR